ncbi:MAG: hypothetical protein FWD13_01085 [Treponema sp.]|nr:hypothetical protein [Treponema sp.]
MKKIARLTLFFSISFILIFLSAMMIKFLSLRVEWAKILPPRPETTQSLMISAAHWALSLSLFSSILLTMNYILRRKFAPFISIICVMTLSFLFCFGISLALNQWRYVSPDQSPGISMGGKGLILSNTLNRNETSVVLLNGTDDPLGPRVTVVSGQPMFYQPITSVNNELPPVPFGDDSPWFLKSVSIDIRLNAEVFQQRFSDNFFSYFLYTGSLIFLLCVLGYAVKFSVWPLANLFLVTLAFRGILALNSFFNSMEMQSLIESFISNNFFNAFALPFFFQCFGGLILFYSLLTSVAKRRYDDDY